MALTDSFPTQDGGGLTITDTRLVLAGLVAQNADGSPRPGIFPSTTDPLVTGNANMTYQIGPFEAASSRTGTGIELLANDASTSVTTDPAPGSNSRIDVIWYQPRFAQHTDPSSVPTFGVTKGVVAPSPVKPAIPSGAFELAYATILSSTTATNTAVITQSAQWTAAAGGIVWLRNSADAWAAPDGAVAFRVDLKKHVDRVDGVWVTRGGGVSLRTSTAQATAGGAYVPQALTWNLEDYDTDGYHSTSSNTSRMVAPARGSYRVTGKLRGLSTAFATGVQLGKNGVVDPAARQVVGPVAGGGAGSFPVVTKTFELAAGDYIEVFSLGEAASLSLHPADCFAEMVKVG